MNFFRQMTFAPRTTTPSSTSLKSYRLLFDRLPFTSLQFRCRHSFQNNNNINNSICNCSSLSSHRYYHPCCCRLARHHHSVVERRAASLLTSCNPSKTCKRSIMSLSLDSPGKQNVLQTHNKKMVFYEKGHRSKVPSSLHHQSNHLLCHGLRFICCSSIKWSQQFVNEFTCRSHTCGQLRAADHGKEVVMYGWVQHNRNGRFIALRDSYGITQLVVPEALVVPEELRTKVVAKIPLESVVCAKGVVRRRPVGQENKNMPTGEVEVILSEIKVVGEANSNLPFQVRSTHNKPKELTRLKFRYLDLRSKEMQYNLRLRSQFLTKVRDFFNAYGFVEVETPTLFKDTPGGAREFVVPTRDKNKFLSLVQSPQQMKQLLMIGGLDRYYQIARCYRDEGTKDDRQPEFTQIDVELSFVRRKDILNLIEQLLLSSWPPIAGKIRVPFPRITYSDAMRSYGTDKPDLRFDMRVSISFYPFLCVIDYLFC